MPNPCALPLPLPMTILAGGRVAACLSEGKGGGRSRGLSWLGAAAGVTEDVFVEYIM